MGQSSYETRENCSEVTLMVTLNPVSTETIEVVLNTMNVSATGGQI